MTLGQRLLLAIGLITVATTVAIGLGVREAWRRAEERAFGAQFHRAAERLERQIDSELRDLSEGLGALCRHDPVLDSVLVDLQAGRFDSGRRLAVSLRVPELMKALSLDELTLVTGAGEVLGAGHERGATGSRRPELARVMDLPAGTRLRRMAPVAIEAHCTKADAGHRLALIGARHLEPLLRTIGESHGLSLTLSPAQTDADQMVRQVALASLGGLPVVATQSRRPLRRALRELDATIVGIGAATVVAALLVAALLARGLARPIVELSRQAGQVISGEPRPVVGRGGKELEEFAASFNRAVSDLAALRKRLAVTERIAARREIARRVAHEIKNPLAPIRAAVETLRRLRARDDPAFDEYFDEATRTVLSEVARITHIVQEFTRFARLPAPRPANMDLAEVAREVVGLHSAGRAPIRLQIEDLPTLVADRDQIVQVLTNLIQNALDATAHTPNPHVAVILERADPRQVRVRIRDNGPGVPESIRDRLFEPYATGKEGGTGLGLPIAQRIVLEHGGDLTYVKPDEGGAEFAFTLPIAGPTLLPEPPPNSERRDSLVP